MAAFSTRKIEKIYELHNTGLSCRAIADKLDISDRSVRRYVAASKDKLDNCAEKTVKKSLTTEPTSTKELAAMVGLDEKKWKEKTVRISSTDKWQDKKKVSLYTTTATFERVLDGNFENDIKEFVASILPALTSPKKEKYKKIPAEDAQMVVYGMWDVHLGMRAWAPEVGSNYSLSIAVDRVHNSIDDMIVELSKWPISKVIMPIGNDLCHFDSVKMTTTRGDHYLDTGDSRYSKVYLSALDCTSYMIKRTLELGCSIEGLYIPGNHDYTTGYSLCVALDCLYKNDTRVTFDLDMSPRKYRSHGGTLIGFDHGKDVPEARYPHLIAAETKELCANSTWREMQIGHTHRRRETWYRGLSPVSGILVRTNPSLAESDSWHFAHGFTGEPLKSVEAYRYDRTGFRGSHVTFSRP